MLETVILADYPQCSRIHRLNSIEAFIKRDDELGFGLSGSKLRKYLSLIPSLRAKGAKEVVVIGSSYSNHVLSCAQLLKENRMQPTLFLLGDPPEKITGNFLFTSLIVGKEKMHWIPRSEGQRIEELAGLYAEKTGALVIPRGASCKEALPGALTLPIDIVRNEKEWGIEFEHIFIDSGTGMMAASLILAFAYCKRKTRIHAVQMAGNPQDFYENLAARQKDFEALCKKAISSPLCFTLHAPQNAASFGSVNAQVFQTIGEYARTEGILLDPIYNAKLFHEGARILRNERLKGNVLFIHSGGGLALSGFLENLAQVHPM